MSDMSLEIQAIKSALSDPAKVLRALGLLTDRRSYERQARGFIIRCLVHKDQTPSCSVQAKSGLLLWKCHACGATGDVLTLIASAYGLSKAKDFHAILRIGAELAGDYQLVEQLANGTPTNRTSIVRPPEPERTPEREYLPTGELLSFFEACTPTASDVEVATWLEGRGLEPDLIDDGRVLARALPKHAVTPPWASHKRVPWTKSGHRLIVPMRDAHGAVRGLRAGRVIPGDSPKRLPPGGFKARGLVMADEFGVAMLTGSTKVTSVVIVEGEPDFLVWATRRKAKPTAVFGIVSGSWSLAVAQRIPVGATVAIRTDNDTAGDKYATEIAGTLHGRSVHRSQGE